MYFFSESIFLTIRISFRVTAVAKSSQRMTWPLQRRHTRTGVTIPYMTCTFDQHRQRERSMHCQPKKRSHQSLSIVGADAAEHTTAISAMMPANKHVELDSAIFAIFDQSVIFPLWTANKVSWSGTLKSVQPFAQVGCASATHWGSQRHTLARLEKHENMPSFRSLKQPDMFTARPA